MLALIFPTPALMKPQKIEVRAESTTTGRNRNARDYYFPIEIKKRRKGTKCREEYTRGRSWGMGDSPIRTLRHYSGISGNFPAAYIYQRRTGDGGGLSNHCLFPLVVLDFLSTTLLSVSSSLPLPSICILSFPYLSPFPFLYFPLILFPALTTSRLSSSHRIIPPSHTPGIDSVIPPPP